MPRVKLQEQKEYDFVFPVTVQAREMNASGHLDHKAVIGMIQDARTTILHDLGMKEDCIDGGHTGVIMADLVVNYKAEIFAFERLSVETRFGEFEAKSYRMFFRVRGDEGGRLVALIEAGFVVYDYLERTVAPMPKSFRRAVSREAT
jgi:acyl-CoA thioesterase FadM